MKTKVLSHIWILLGILILPYSSLAQWQWAKSAQSGVNNQNFSTCVRTDEQGNAYFLGQSFNFAKVETDSIFFGNSPGCFIAKYNSAGIYQFLITAPKPSSTFSRFVITGGRLYFAVAFKDTVHKPNGQFDVYPGSTGLAIYSYNPNNGNYNGVFVTALTKNNSTLPSLTQLESDPSGNLVVFGNGTINNSAQDTMRFGSKFKFGTNKGVGNQFSFLTKLSVPSGDALWLKTSNSITIGNNINNIYRNSLAVDADGNVILGFNQEFNINIDPDTSITRPTNMLYKKNIFIIKFSANGNLSFIKQYGSNLTSGSSTSDQDYIYGLATDADKNIVITGRYGQALDFGTQTIQPTISGKSNFYLAKFNSMGIYEWSKQVDSTGDGTSGNSIKCIGSTIIVGGTFDKQIKIGTTTLIRMGNNDAFIAKYNGDGSFISAGGCHTGAKEWIHDIAADPSGNIYVSGLYQFSSFPNQGLLLLPGNITMPQGAINGTLFWAKYGQGAPPPPPLNPPKAPVNLVATATSSSQVVLNWVDSANNETGFVIQGSSNGSNWLSLDSVAANITTFSQSGLNPSTIYHYRVYAKNNDGNSAYSNTDTALTHSNIPNPTAPNAPSGLSATAMLKKAGTKIQLSWTDNSENETTFELERSTDGSNFNLLQSLPANTTNYLDTGLNFSTTYYYRIKATNAVGASAYSNTANTNTLPNGLIERESFQFVFYPNPAEDIINVFIPTWSFEKQMIHIFNSEGALVKEIQTLGQNTKIDVTPMINGVYFIEFSGTVKKVIVKH